MNGVETERLDRLKKKFAKAYDGASPEFVVRAPGTATLIGEHTDHGGPVCSLAIDHKVLIAVSPSDDSRVEVRNVQTVFAPRKFELEEIIHPYPAGDWGNYVKAAVQSLNRHGRVHEELEWPDPAGCRMLVDGDVPMGIALASSAALMAASALAFLGVNKRSLDPQVLAELLAESGPFTGGDESGTGITTALCAQVSSALNISSFPLKISPVAIPAGAKIVIADAMEMDGEAEESAHHRHSLRSIECLMALEILARSKPSPEIFNSAVRISDLAALEPDHTKLLEYVEKTLSSDPYTVKDIALSLDTSPKAIFEQFLTSDDDEQLPKPEGGFRLGARVRHLLGEKRRVQDAAIALKSGDVGLVGKLMNESHNSSRDNFDTSTEDLDELVSVALEGGAFGARGFGGSVVCLVDDTKKFAFMEHLREEYYSGYLGIDEEGDLPGKKSWQNVVFATDAVAGAEVCSEI